MSEQVTLNRVYLLWDQDFYVDENGRTEPPSLQGVFSNLDTLNTYAQQFWFDLTVDVRGKVFAPGEMRFEGTGKQYGAVYVQCWEIDPTAN